MKNYYLALMFSVLLVPVYISYASNDDNHDHAHEDPEHSDVHSDHADEEEHEHGKEQEGHQHSENAEESSSIGPEKGIIAKSDEGFKLSPEAEKTIGLSTITIANGSIRLQQKAVVKTKSEKSVFRLRNGWYKRIPIEIVSRDQDFAVIKSSHLKSGDQVVTANTGFLRIAEIFSEEGAEHSHAH